ncbi:MAG: hypothetical protein E7385_02755 [Ruminococcaceae bacterium]|nr:hypothetical protein [Oscillospiraceae bacterium]
MTKQKIETYITRDKKRNAIIAFCIVLSVFIIIAILELLPGNAPDLSQEDEIGVSRRILFPFVFTDESKNLFLINDKYEILPIDDTVSQNVHDISAGKVYYLRSNALYEYNIKKNTRKVLVNNCIYFRLMEERSVLLVVDAQNMVKLYQFKGNKIITLSNKSVPNLLSDELYCVGENGVVFADNADPETGKIDLLFSNNDGKVKKIATAVDPGKNFYLSNNDKFICFKKDGALKIVDTKGKQVVSVEGAQIVKPSINPVLTEPSTETFILNQTIPITYLLSDVTTSDNTTTAKLLYFNGEKLKNVAEKVSNIIYYSAEDDMILYTVQNEESSVIYMSTNGSKPQKQITCDKNATFMYQETLGLLYFKNEDDTLNRYKVLDISLKVSKISDNTGFLYGYHNKKIMAYQKNDGSHNAYILLKKGNIEKIDMENEIRLYGLDDDAYLLCRKYSEDKLSLDLVINDEATRLCTSISNGVYFDSNMEYVLYSSEGNLYIWNNGSVVDLGSFSNITPALLTA